MDIREAAIVLGISQDATIEQVRDAYRSHARLLHPDRLGEASEADKQTAHRAMARINDAYAVFQARFRLAGGDQEGHPSKPDRRSGSSPNPRPKPPPASAHQQAREDRRIAQFDALLSHPRGWDLTGVLRIIRTYGATYGSGGRVSAVFESDDLDARGNPVFDEEVFVAMGVRASSEGTLALRGGGSLVLMGGRWEAERVLTLLGLDPSLAQPKRRSNRRVLVYAGAGIVALIASLGVVAVLASDAREDPVPAAGAASPPGASPVAEESSSPSEEKQVTCSPGGPCAVGDTGPGGGIIFYDAGSPQPWGRYLEVARTDWSGEKDPAAVWCTKASGLDRTVWSDDYEAEGPEPPPAYFPLGPAIGSGARNTQLIIDRCGQLNAAGLAAGYSAVVNGSIVSNWYLPTRDELELLGQVPDALAETSAAYWSSSSCRKQTEVLVLDDDGLRSLGEQVGGLSGAGQPSSCLNQGAMMLVRPVRAF